MFSNSFNQKNDPLLEAVKGAMQDGELRRQAEALVNEEFGVYSRKAVIREELAAYDARLEEAYKCMKEGKPLADKDYDKDGKVESPKDEVWGSRLRAAKKAGKLEEGPMDAGSMQGSKSVTQDRDPKATSYDKTLPKEYPGAASSAPTAQRLSNAKASVSPIKEGQLDVTGNSVTAPKEFQQKRGPNKNAVTKAPVPNEAIAEAKKWIQAAIKKKGALSKQLGVPEKENIPAGKLAAAAEKGGKLGKRARLAQTLKKLHKEDTSF